MRAPRPEGSVRDWPGPEHQQVRHGVVAVGVLGGAVPLRVDPDGIGAIGLEVDVQHAGGSVRATDGGRSAMESARGDGHPPAAASNDRYP